MIHVFENFISEKECSKWISKAPSFVNYDWENRVIDISKYPITKKVKKFLEKELNIKTEIDQSQIQLWPIDSHSDIHVHDSYSRNHGDFNSLLYLNDNFEGGEFITEKLIIEPKPGLLTFFDGSKIYHGVNRVRKHHRYTLIFWWKNTVFN